MSTSSPIKLGYRRYLIELTIALAIYIVAILIRGWLLRGPLLHSEAFWPRVLVALLPVVPVALMIAAIIRCLHSMDELMRRIQTESLAVAGAVTAMMAVTYGLLEGPHFPFLSAWWTYTLFMGTWLLAALILRWRYC